jgi:lysophospholipase L1-like esterase
MRKRRFIKNILFILVLLSGVQPLIAGIKAENRKVGITFQGMTEGKISFDLVIPVSEEPLTINIKSIVNSNDETVFSIPVVTGEILYPYQIDAGNHRFDISVDLRFNFCKVFIDGDWLTTVLAKKQYDFINCLSIEGNSADGGRSEPGNFQAKGMMSEIKTPVRIVALGASTTATRRTITGVFCQRMPEHFKDHNIPVHVFNAGIGGSHSGHLSDNSRFKIKHALDRFDEAVLAKDPDFVIINLGINDSWVDSDDPKDDSRIPLPKYRENILYMVNTLKERNITVILMTPNALGEKIASWRYKRTEKYINALRKIARKEKLPLIDQWKMMNELASIPGNQIDDFLLPDSMHTNDLWHKISAVAISELIIDLLNKK